MHCFLTIRSRQRRRRISFFFCRVGVCGCGGGWKGYSRARSITNEQAFQGQNHCYILQQQQQQQQQQNAVSKSVRPLNESVVTRSRRYARPYQLCCSVSCWLHCLLFPPLCCCRARKHNGNFRMAYHIFLIRLPFASSCWVLLLLSGWWQGQMIPRIHGKRPLLCSKSTQQGLGWVGLLLHCVRSRVKAALLFF